MTDAFPLQYVARDDLGAENLATTSLQHEKVYSFQKLSSKDFYCLRAYFLFCKKENSSKEKVSPDGYSPTKGLLGKWWSLYSH
jgi:hypothetical protein